ncbi:DinB/UmuC family translesion DNA polymerase [Floccifex sp.]|uniref:Y-family DNA polymerase n=1 Tax=Floccifex sp. TaxID=2815810 RepID=UPI003F108CB7
MKTYIAIDLKSFYASVECIERGLNPLTTNLVVADESRTQTTICLAVSPSLKQYGLPGRCRLFEVEQKCLEIQNKNNKKINYIIAPPRMSLYIEYSTKIYQVYTKYISEQDIHVYSIDEVFIDISSYLSFYKMNAHDFCVFLLKEIYKTTGITATAGIGTNLYLAKVAMDIVAKHANPDENGVRIASLDEISFRKQLWNHKPLTDFWRIGKGIASRLEKNGITTMKELAIQSIQNEDWFYQEFGVDAEILIDHAWGYEPCTMEHIKAYRPSLKSFSYGQVLSRGYSKKEGCIILKEMIDQMVLDLTQKGCKTNSISIYIGYEFVSNYKGNTIKDGYGRILPKGLSKSISLQTYTSDSKKIVNLLLDFYQKQVDETLLIRRFMLSCNNVKKMNETFEQLSLFETVEENIEQEKLNQTILDIQKKYGKNAIVKGTNLEQGATTLERNTQIGGHKA